MRWMPRFMLLLGLLSLPVSAISATPEDTFLSANQAYQDGNFAQALEQYRSIRESGLTAPALEFNLGNAALKLGRLGWAVYHYRMALRMDPGYENASANLAYVRAQTRDVKPDDQARTAWSWMGDLRLGPTRAAMLLFLLISTSFAWGIVRLIWLRDRAWTAVVQGVLGGVGLLLVAALVFELAQDQRMEGVIVEAVTEVRAGPGTDYTVSFRLHEGTEVELLRESSGWWELKVSDKLQGWIPATTLATIE